MRKLIIMTLVLVIALAGTAVAKDKVYGKGVSKGDISKISAIMADTDGFQGKTVRIEGTAVAVCSHRGCWVEIASDTEGETLRLKVTDGEIVFPKKVVGEHIVAEGMFTANHVTKDHKACSHKGGHDEGKEEAGSCTTYYQVTGTGAVVNYK